MNKTQLQKIIKEELQSVLKEFKSTTLMDLEYVIEALSYRWKEADDGGLIEHVRKVGREAKEAAPFEDLGTGEYLMRIARLSVDAAHHMEQANKVLTRATQKREDLLALESPLDEADSLGAGRTIEEVWQSLQDNAFQAHKDLQMLAIHLGNAKYTTEEVDNAVDTLERMLNMLNQDVRRDVQGVVSQTRRGE